MQGRQTTVGGERTTAGNSTLAIGGVSSPLDSFVVVESSVLRTKFCPEKPAHRQSANRYKQFYEKTAKQKLTGKRARKDSLDSSKKLFEKLINQN
jgi:hypothetical protein